MDTLLIKHKIEDHMLLGSVYDNIMKKTKYRDPKLAHLYNVMMAQKHRMLYYKQMKSHYYADCTSVRAWEQGEKKYNPDTVWVCWLQGMEQAPLIVKRCVESLRANLPNKKIIILDKDNLFDYVDFPDYIVEKWRKGIIGPAHFTDLLRLELLIKYGGYWVDATVLCTDGRIFPYIEAEPLFLYSFFYFDFNPEIMQLNNWFIYSCTNNNILCLTRELLYAYWKEKNRAVNYFIFHIMMTLALDYYEEEYKKIPIISQADAHVLAAYIFDRYEQRKYELLKSQTGIHKLSTRFDPERMTEKGTFYDVVIEQGNW